MTASLVTALFAAALIASLLARLWLATRQIRHVATHRDAVPAAFAGTVVASRRTSGPPTPRCRGK